MNHQVQSDRHGPADVPQIADAPQLQQSGPPRASARLAAAHRTLHRLAPPAPQARSRPDWLSPQRRSRIICVLTLRADTA
jgi:hypothetical protein